MTDPQLSPAARAEFDAALSRSIDKLFEAPQAADVLAAFLAGEALIVMSRDQLVVRPAGDTPPEVEPPAPGMYL